MDIRRYPSSPASSHEQRRTAGALRGSNDLTMADSPDRAPPLAALLELMGDHELRRLLPDARIHRLSSRERLVGPAQQVGTLFIVSQGVVRLYLSSPDGREITLFSRGAGDVFELREIDSDLAPQMLAEAADGPATVLSMGWAPFVEMLGSQPALASSVAEALRRSLIGEQRLIAELAFYSVRSRLAHKLVELAQDAPGSVVHATRDRLASMVGTRQEEVTKALRHFREQRLLHYEPHGRTISILDMDRLGRYGDPDAQTAPRYTGTDPETSDTRNRTSEGEGR